jgi:hypothetical protein
LILSNKSLSDSVDRTASKNHNNTKRFFALLFNTPNSFD